jgi:cytochrome P450
MIPWEDGWSSATSIDKDLHKVLRRTVSSGFNSDSLKQFEPAILKNFNAYFTKILEDSRYAEDGWSALQEMNHWSMHNLERFPKVLLS